VTRHISVVSFFGITKEGDAQGEEKGCICSAFMSSVNCFSISFAFFGASR
jgi:hypothetical protein